MYSYRDIYKVLFGQYKVNDGNRQKQTVITVSSRIHQELDVSLVQWGMSEVWMVSDIYCGLDVEYQPVRGLLILWYGVFKSGQVHSIHAHQPAAMLQGNDFISS